MNCGRFPITVRTRALSPRLLGYRVEMVGFKVRDTVQGVVGASRHLLWYLDWQTGGDRARTVAPRVRHRSAEPSARAA